MTVTRFAPSPTGYIHVGNLRTALMNYLIARQTHGKFILRLDDTDPERSKGEYADAIQEDLEWLGLEWDQIERQSARLERYEEAAQSLRDAGRLYEAFETPTDLDLKRKKQLNMGKPPVYDRAALALSAEEKDRLRAERGGHWRFLLDQTRISWADHILGEISIDAASVSDPVLIKASGQFLYTLASVVDDHDFGVTHVVRGSDHVTNTATQIQIFEAMGGVAPSFGHHSLLTGPQGESLSKRLGTLSLRDLRAAGVEPMALLSLMARLGSSDPVEPRLSLEEIAAGFDLTHFGAAPTKFDVEDLTPLSARILSLMPADMLAHELTAAGVPQAQHAAFWAAIHQNVAKRSEIADWWGLCQNGATPDVAAEDAEFVAQALALLPDTPWDATSWSTWSGAVKEATGRKGRGLFMPLRKLMTGQSHGPDMGALMPFLQHKPQI